VYRQLWNRITAVVFSFPALLARFGLIDRKKGDAAFELAVPAMVSGALRVLLRTSDFFMVSLASGTAAVAALEIGFQYYFIPFGLSLAFTSATISLVSRYWGASRLERANLVIKQSLWLALAISIPITIVSWLFAEEMVGLLTSNPTTVAEGGSYVRIVMLTVVFRFWSMIAARALAGASDTTSPMYVRLLTLPTNIVLNALLIFGPGPFPALGVAGAAWGTALANLVEGVLFLGMLLSGRYAVQLTIRGRQWDGTIVRELLRVALPLAGMRLSRTLGRFPFLFILGALGTEVLAAYAIGRRIMLLALMPAWGYSTAASTLVGQEIGAGDASEATAYGWQTLRLALATQLLLASVLLLAAEPIARLFGTQHVGLTVSFIRVFGVGVAGFSVSRTMRGGLRGAGDMRWPFYGGLIATYLIRLPVAALALPTAFVLSVGPYSLGSIAFGGVMVSPGLGLGLLGIYMAILGGMYTRAFVNVARFRSGRWLEIGQQTSGVGAE